MEKTNILITGGAGNIGAALAKALIQKENYFIVIADDFSTGKKENLPQPASSWTLEIGTINDTQFVNSLFTKYKFQYVFHYAAIVGVLRTIANPIKVLDDIAAAKNIVEACVEGKVKRLFYSSSSEIYGQPLATPQNEETTPPNAYHPYGLAKIVNEAYIQAYHKTHSLNYTIFRFFNTYGSLQSTDFVIPKFVSAAKKNEDIIVYGDGSQIRTFCYIDDNVDTAIACLENEKGINQTINVGSDVEITIQQLGEKVIEITKSASKIKYVPAIPEDFMSQRKPDNAKMLAILNRPLVDLDTGLKQVIMRN